MKRVVRRYECSNGRQRLEVFDHQDGFYSFEESGEAVEDIPDLGPEVYWMTTYVSGLYDSLDAAERDAKSSIPWMRGL